MKQMIAIALFAAVSALPAFANATDYSMFEGRYVNSTTVVDVHQENQNLYLTFVSGWVDSILGSTYIFPCNGNTCGANLPNAYVQLFLLDNGDFIFSNPAGNESIRFSQRPADGGSSWKLSQTVDKSGILVVTAAVANAQAHASLLMQCTAPSTDVKMMIQVSDVLWKAVAYSVNVDKETLQVTAQVKGNTYTLNSWSLEDGNLMVRVDTVTAAELADLRAGNLAKLHIATVDAAGKATALVDLQFSLQGSSNALTQLQKRCSGAADVNSLAL